MTIAGTGSVEAAAGAVATPAGGPLHKAAQQFEGMMIGTLWSAFQNDPMTAPEDSDAGGDNIRAMGVQAMSTALAGKGGLGMGAMIERQLGAAAARENPGGPAPGPARSPAAAQKAYAAAGIGEIEE